MDCCVKNTFSRSYMFYKVIFPGVKSSIQDSIIFQNIQLYVYPPTTLKYSQWLPVTTTYIGVTFWECYFHKMIWQMWFRCSTSAMTLVCVWNTRVFRTALRALTEPRTVWRRITCYPAPRRQVALHRYLLHFVVMYKHHQNDMCDTLFAGAAVMLKPLTECLAMFMPFSGRVPHFTSPPLLYIGSRTLPIYVWFWDVVTYYNTVFASDRSLAVAFALPLSYFTGLNYTV